MKCPLSWGEDTGHQILQDFYLKRKQRKRLRSGPIIEKRIFEEQLGFSGCLCPAVGPRCLVSATPWSQRGAGQKGNAGDEQRNLSLQPWQLWCTPTHCYWTRKCFWIPWFRQSQKTALYQVLWVAYCSSTGQELHSGNAQTEKQFLALLCMGIQGQLRDPGPSLLVRSTVGTQSLQKMAFFFFSFLSLAALE